MKLSDLNNGELVVAPGVWDGLTARIAEQAGFRALCASGFSIAAGLGQPDAELYTMSENLNAVRTIREASTVPIIADIDTGYGNALNARRTALRFLDAGVSAIFMEDQASPKRCPLAVTGELPLVDIDEAASKIRAVKDAVGDRLIVIGRTDSTGDDALRRAEAYVAAGADLIMPVTKTFSTVEEWARCREVAGVPLVTTLTASAWTEKEFTPAVMREIGIAIALLPTQVLMAVAGAATTTLRRLAAGEDPTEVGRTAMSHHDFVDMIGMADIAELEARYLPAPETSGV